MAGWDFPTRLEHRMSICGGVEVEGASRFRSVEKT